MHKKTQVPQNNIPDQQIYRAHLIVFDLYDGKKNVTVYRGVCLTSYKVIEHSFSLMGWEEIRAWAQELIDSIWAWYIERVDDERDPLWRNE